MNECLVIFLALGGGGGGLTAKIQDLAFSQHFQPQLARFGSRRDGGRLLVLELLRPNSVSSHDSVTLTSFEDFWPPFN